ncbi:MAG TPA: FHA domain-containing protein, partial [Ktedonobacterales bacterium]|nr:FHA domain-containing protein [Ktedonobacterales bacterium]
ILPVHDFGEQEGWAYSVMDYIKGGALRDLLVQADATGQRLDLFRTLGLIQQAALALDFAHSQGIVHRDVKPGNMLLRSDNQLLLSDFGIAWILEANRAFSRSGAIAGTPQYMAPEQGTPGGTVDGRTDVYALGVVLFQCMTGRLPFNADTQLAVLMLHAREPVPRPSLLAPGLPPAIDQIILRALAKDPADRYQRASELAEALADAAGALRGMPLRARAPTHKFGDGEVPQGATAVRTPAVPGEADAPGTCFRCGSANDPRDRYCTTCGYELSGRRGAVDRFLLPNGRPLRCRILVRNGPLAGQRFILHQDVTTLGRTQGNDIILPHPTVSRFHARLEFRDGQWYLEDLNSSNGTCVNRVRIDRPAPLMEGDELRLGDEVMDFGLDG